MNNAPKQNSKLSIDVDGSPVKDFFVSMLTRDIQLTDAILDLLDNCVDGILRNNIDKNTPLPYKGFEARIIFNKTTFSISDNCGGIPWALKDYAFRLGHSDKTPNSKKATVGIYGIGMKRALFKMGRHCLITTKNKKDS